MGSLIEKHKSEEMGLISAIVAAATAQTMVQTDYWNGVDESNTCGSTWEWQDADGNGISVVNATCSGHPTPSSPMLTLTVVLSSLAPTPSLECLPAPLDPPRSDSSLRRPVSTAPATTPPAGMSPPTARPTPTTRHSPAFTSRKTSTITVEARTHGTSRSLVSPLVTLSPSTSRAPTRSPT